MFSSYSFNPKKHTATWSIRRALANSGCGGFFRASNTTAIPTSFISFLQNTWLTFKLLTDIMHTCNLKVANDISTFAENIYFTQYYKLPRQVWKLKITMLLNLVPCICIGMSAVVPGDGVEVQQKFADLLAWDVCRSPDLMISVNLQNCSTWTVLSTWRRQMRLDGQWTVTQRWPDSG